MIYFIKFQICQTEANMLGATVYYISVCYESDIQGACKRRESASSNPGNDRGWEYERKKLTVLSGWEGHTLSVPSIKTPPPRAKSRATVEEGNKLPPLRWLVMRKNKTRFDYTKVIFQTTVISVTLPRNSPD